MVDRYAVIGNPVGHSKSPQIHAAFAAQTGQAMVYERVLGVPGQFEEQVRSLLRDGLRGLNVTLPFKERALALADQATPRARLAGAANTLHLSEDGLLADNTDGIGLARDLRRLGVQITGGRLLILGAGGAVRGILGPLLEQRPACVHIHNRTEARALVLAEAFAAHPGGRALAVIGTEALPDAHAYDLVINGTSASLAGASLALPPSLFATAGAAYDLAYRLEGATVFLEEAQRAGAATLADGLGMLVEQAAEAFALWRGIHPDSLPVLQALRSAPPSPQ